MAMPKKRMSQTRTGTRRSQIQAVLPTIVKCAQCSSAVAPHTACANCGSYRGRAVIDVEKNARKLAARQAAEHDHGHDHATT